VARKASPARLVLALSVAAVLAIFLLYTSLAGGGNPSIAPSGLDGRSSKVQLVGIVVGPVRGESYGSGMRFVLRDRDGTRATGVPVLYAGSKPDLFKVGREIVVRGSLRNGTFVAEPGSMITKCPSKYTPKNADDPA
jgi:cytochrome c-type biogenesis protein CcmE